MTWSIVSINNQSMPEPRLGHSFSTLSSTSILLFGGMSGDKVLSDTWVFQIDNPSWYRVDCLNGPEARAGHVCFNGVVWAGMLPQPPKLIESMYRFDMNAMAWKELVPAFSPPGPPSSRMVKRMFDSVFMMHYIINLSYIQDVAMAVLSNKVMFFGGMDFKHMYNDMFMLEL